jgi:hypothetical protein
MDRSKIFLGAKIDKLSSLIFDQKPLSLNQNVLKNLYNQKVVLRRFE